MISLEHTTIAANGINLHVVQAGNPSDPLVLLLHGFPDFWEGWHAQIEPLVQAGYRVWVPDQRGYNLSDKPQGLDPYSIDELVKDILGLIDAAGCEKCILVGHDWGGGVAWWLANKYPDRLHKLVILNVPHPTVMRRMVMKEGFWQQRLISWYMYAFQVPWLPTERILSFNKGMFLRWWMRWSSRRGTFNRQTLDRYWEAWHRTGAMTGMLNWYRASFGHTKVERPPRTEVLVPTLIIWGAKDRFLHLRTGERSVQICSDGRLEVLPMAGHWVQHEEPQRVTELLLAFLKG